DAKVFPRRGAFVDWSYFLFEHPLHFYPVKIKDETSTRLPPSRTSEAGREPVRQGRARAGGCMCIRPGDRQQEE
ncbi:MAG TPA: hypothetical protein PLN54_03490, partial [Flavobacteriales bacterium]|nr:hypothetical protein [Flavobacteriales bacterium]